MPWSRPWGEPARSSSSTWQGRRPRGDRTACPCPESSATARALSRFGSASAPSGQSIFLGTPPAPRACARALRVPPHALAASPAPTPSACPWLGPERLARRPHGTTCTTASTVSRSQYQNAPSPQAYLSHHQPPPHCGDLGLIVVSSLLTPWQQAHPLPDHSVRLLPLHSLGRHTKLWRSNHSHIPSRTSPPLAPEANDHASTAHPQTRKASHSLDFNFDVQETGGSSDQPRDLTRRVRVRRPRVRRFRLDQPRDLTRRVRIRRPAGCAGSQSC